MADELTKVRVKTRTGQTRFRAGRTWQPNAWTRLEVDAKDLAELQADPYLDVEPLPPTEDLDSTPPSLEEQVALLTVQLAALTAENARLAALVPAPEAPAAPASTEPQIAQKPLRRKG